ncbi:MAG: hypothetical protein ACLGG7_00270 [Bacteriovoracia bacterium]
MENILLTIVVVLLVILLILLIGLAYLGVRLLKSKGKVPDEPALLHDDRLHPDIKLRLAEAKSAKRKLREEATCVVHPKEPSEGSCAICAQYFCHNCLKPQQSLLFCREHVSLYLSSSWTEVHSVKSNPHDPEAGVELVDWKKGLWDSENVPTIIQTHYKINVDGDQIESWVVLLAREKEAAEVKERLANSLNSPT